MHMHELRAQPEHEHTELHLVQHTIPVEVTLPHHTRRLLLGDAAAESKCSGRASPEAVRSDDTLRRIHEQSEPLAQLFHQPLRA